MRPQGLQHSSPMERYPVTILGVTMAAGLGLLMLYLPYQFRDWVYAGVYPNLRLFGVVFGVAGACMAAVIAGLGVPLWLSRIGKVLLAGGLLALIHAVLIPAGLVTREMVYGLIAALLLRVAIHWLLRGHWTGAYMNGTLAVAALVYSAYLRWPWATRLSGLRLRLAVAAVVLVAVPLFGLGAGVLYVVQRLDREEALGALTAIAMQIDQALYPARYADPGVSTREIAALLKSKAPDPFTTVDLMPLQSLPHSWPADLLGSLEEVAPQQGWHRVAFIRHPDLGLAVVVARQELPGYQLTRRTAEAILLGTAILAALAALAGLSGAQRVIRPLAQVRDVAAAIGQQHFGSRVPVPERGQDEITDLAVTINEMADILERQRVELQAQQQRLAFLAEASSWVGSTLDHATTLAEVAQLSVPVLADCCVLGLVENDGRIRPVSMAHKDPEGAMLLETLMERFPPETFGKDGGPASIRTGEPLLVPQVSDAFIAECPNPEQTELVRSLRPQSYLTVPLIARGRPIGVFALLRTTPGAEFGPADVAVAESLAYRAALAAENARLYHEAQEAVRRLEESLALLDAIFSSAHGHTIGVGTVLMDITESQRTVLALRESESLLSGQKQILEMIAKGSPLAEVLNATTRFVETRSGDCMCGVELLDRDGDGFVRVTDGNAVGPTAGSCGTAVFRREPVLVTDVSTDPLCSGFRDAADDYGIAACWAHPSSTGRGRSPAS